MTTKAKQTGDAALTKRTPVTETVLPRKLPRAAKVKDSPRPAPAAKSQSKQECVLALLRRKEGVTVSAIMKATGWQQHSVRGFLAGVVRKKLRLNLVSRESDGKRVYRVLAGKLVGLSNRKRAF